MAAAFVGLTIACAAHACAAAGANETTVPLGDLATPDPQHPRPAWVASLAAQPFETQRKEFRRIPLNEQIEFALFRFRDAHPPETRWMKQIREEANPTLATSLSSLLRAERSDSLIYDYARLVQMVAPCLRAQSYELVVTALRARILRILDSYDRTVSGLVLDEVQDRHTKGDASCP
ncbi:MAG TPA: hypothetical protein VI356_20220 [Myxococcales bacterium]